MKINLSRRNDLALAGVFGALTVSFILLMIFNDSFFNWVWDRHHNILSWYIRPVTLVPFMYFAYKKSFSGMSFSIFALATSMAWFPKPSNVSKEVIDFLDMEIEFLTQGITVEFVLLWLIVPVVFILLAIALWKKSFFYGGFVLIASVVIKMIWSVLEGGESGWTLVFAATFGLVASLLLVYYGYKKSNKQT